MTFERFGGFALGSVAALLLVSLALLHTPTEAPAAAQTAAAAAVFESPEIRARAAVVYDVSEKRILFAKNEHAQLPLASLIKVPLALVTRLAINANESIIISDAAIAQEGESGFHAGDIWEAQKLVDFVLVSSSNDGAFALAEAINPRLRSQYSAPSSVSPTVWRMNNFFASLGLARTYAVNVTGLDESTTLSGAYGTAYEYAQLFAYAITHYPTVLAATTENGLVVDRENVAENTNEALGVIPGLIAGKTGYTDLAGGNLATAFDAGVNRPIVIVVLGSTRDERFTDTRTLVEKTLVYLKGE